MTHTDPYNPRTPGTAGPDRTDFERFTRRLIGLARSHLDARWLHKIDPEDVVQSAYKSFLVRYGDVDVASQDTDRLWALLTMITLRKCADRIRYYKADRRCVRREARSAESGKLDPWLEVVDREPTPDHVAMMTDIVTHILTELPPAERPVIELSLQGYSTQEVSDQLGRAERSVRRLRQRLKQRLESLQSADA